MLVTTLGIICGWPTDLRADNGWEGQVLSLNWENDALARADRHYTQGLKINYYTADSGVPRWAKWLSDHVPTLGMDKGADKLGLGISQDMYTPEDLRRSDVILDDQPYAGWLYGSLILQRRGQTAHAVPVMESLRVDLGIIGPESLAEPAQKLFHEVPPRGWKNQLKTEPGFALRCQRSYRFAWSNADRSWAVVMIPYGGASLGNIAVNLAVGTVVKAGWHIPNPFEVPKETTPFHWGAYIFGGLEGRLVAHDIFLDGNTCQPSHAVPKELGVADYSVGCSIVLKRFEIIAAQVFRTHEFKSQKTSDSFGSICIIAKF